MFAWIFELRSQTRFERNTRGRYVMGNVNCVSLLGVTFFFKASRRSRLSLLETTNITTVTELSWIQAEQEAAMYQFEIDELKIALEREQHEKQQLKNVLDEFETSLADIAGTAMAPFSLTSLSYCLYGAHA